MLSSEETDVILNLVTFQRWEMIPLTCCQLSVIVTFQRIFPVQKVARSTCPACDAIGSLSWRLHGLKRRVYADTLREVIWQGLTVWSCITSFTTPFQCEFINDLENILIYVYFYQLFPSVLSLCFSFCSGKPLNGYGWRDQEELGLATLEMWSQWVLHCGTEAARARGCVLRWHLGHWNNGGRLDVLDNTASSVKKK